MSDHRSAFQCPKCGQSMRYVASRPNFDPELPKFFLYECPEHGIYHFSRAKDMTAGPPPND
jgi:predicted RNA-binding Zn-ribbon protein involved in translation (DUF1610 family)